jgi:hypothetical protein
MTATTATLAVTNWIDAATATLTANRRLAIETNRAPEDYRLSHPIGAVLVGYDGSTYANRPQTNALVQDRDLRVTATVFVRVHDDGGMTPEEWLEFVVDAVAGKAVPGSRRSRRHAYVLEDKLVKEHGGVRVLRARFVLPTTYIEQEYRS